MKPTIKSLQKDVKKLEDKLSKIPDIKVCVECGDVKPLAKFMEVLCYYGSCLPPKEKDYCKSCKEDVETKEKAASIAKNNPKKVVKWWGSGK